MNSEVLYFYSINHDSIPFLPYDDSHCLQNMSQKY